MSLPRLYLTAQTHKRVKAPAHKGVFVDEASGEICWPARACYAPNCPGRAADGEPLVFIAPDPGVYVKPDGTFGYDPARASPDKNSGACPECLKGRNLATETDQQRQRYINWVRPYVLPETARRLEELDEERKRRLEELKRRKQRKP